MRAVTALLLGLALAPAPALAFHDARDFAAPGIDGGGGGVLFTGSPRFAGYDCSMCHTDGPRTARLSVTSDPPSLLETGRFIPGARVVLTVQLEGAERGRAGLSDRNSFVAELVDEGGQVVGTLETVDERVELVDLGRAAAPSPSFATGTVWSFAWTAPEPGTGPVWLHVAAVDGDGHDRTGDDVATLAQRFAELGGSQTPQAAGYQGGCVLAPGAPAPVQGVLGVVLLAAASRLRGRRHRRATASSGPSTFAPRVVRQATELAGKAAHRLES